MHWKPYVTLVLGLLVGIPIGLHLTAWSTPKTKRTPGEMHQESQTLKSTLAQNNVNAVVHADETPQPSNPDVQIPPGANLTSATIIQRWIAECPAPTAKANVIGKNLKTEAFRCVKLTTLRPTVQICVHNTKDDKWVSGKIVAGQFWEKGIVAQFQKILTAHRDLHVIDLGANVGQYSLIAAHMGRKVLAVEARLLHAHMIQRSVQLNNFHDKITLVQNALSDSYGQVSLGTYTGNQGGTYVKTKDTDEKEAVAAANVRTNMTSFTILMNDLVPLVNFSKAIMKIDIEAFEDRAFHCGQKLFEKVQIPFIFMEWVAMRKRPGALPMLAWLESKDYEPLEVGFKPLQYANRAKWPNDVTFRHKSFTLPAH